MLDRFQAGTAREQGRRWFRRPAGPKSGKPADIANAILFAGL